MRKMQITAWLLAAILLPCGAIAQDRAGSPVSKAGTSVKDMLAAANAVVPSITPAQAKTLMASGNAVVVDLRDAPEVEKTGKIAGAINVSRGMLEFRADADTPYHDKNFTKDNVLILYCASGGRSALGGKVLKDMGYAQVYNLGAFKDWVAAGGAIDKAN